MNYNKLIFWLVFLIYWGDGYNCDEHEQMQDIESINKRMQVKENVRSTFTILSESISEAVNNDNLQETCSADDINCLAIASNDKLGLDAIRTLHEQLDDDANGNIDITETSDFLREDLKYDSGVEKRQKAFHQNDDMHISVKELWDTWLRSEVHNWTVEQATEWLINSVELPQYVPNFIKHRVTGASLPRLAVNNMHYLSNIGIKDPIHKQKISLKAMDVVLFGPPKEGQTHWKDLSLITLFIGCSLGAWYGWKQDKKFKKHLNRMNKDMEGLQNAERALETLQKELEYAKQAKEHVATEKEDLERRLQETSGDSTLLHGSYSDLEVSHLKAEIEMLRTELQIAEGELKDRCWNPPSGLQQWLQLTHEIENKAYVKKKMNAERQLQQAREACEKLRKKRSSLVGAFVSTHGKSIDDVDRSIVEARTALNEVTQELQERVHRWKQIEMLCGFNIINNSGLQSLENSLYRNANGRFLSLRGRSIDDLDDETSSLYTTTGYVDSGLMHHNLKDPDSSSSDISKQDEESLVGDGVRHGGSVQFLVGGEVTNWNEDLVTRPPANRSTITAVSSSNRSLSNNNILVTNKKGSMIRSQSQEVGLPTTGGPSETVTVVRSKAYSDTSLDHPPIVKHNKQSIIHKTIKEQPSISLDDDVQSTDSLPIDDETRKKKRKLFSGFTKKKVKGN